MSQFLALAAGGGISGIVGILVAFVQQTLARRTLHQTHRRQLLSELVSATSAGNMRIGELARASMAEKEEIRNSDGYRKAVDVFNTAVVQIELTETQVVVEQAVKIDKILTEIAQKAMTGQFTRNEWLLEREPVHEEVRAFLKIARQELGSPRLPQGDNNLMHPL